MSERDSNDFYVYIHRRKDNNSIFYVGKGRADRFKTRSGRNKHWRGIVEKYGFVPEIVTDELTEDGAFQHEQFLIASLRVFGSKLANHSDGGGWGCTGYKHSPESLQKMSAAKTGKSLSDSHRDNIRAGWRPRRKVSTAEVFSNLTRAMYGMH